jgi:hypothetical protein
LIFRIGTYRFEFRAAGNVYFPPGKAGNVLRGALGEVLAGALTPREPGAKMRPSGLADPPRPFVLRASHLDGKRFEQDETFALDVHVFDLRTELIEMFETAFGDLARTGLGPGRGAVELRRPVAGSVVEIDLLSPTESSGHIRVVFRTPTELKGNPSRAEVPFGVLFARIRDRVAMLRRLYGEGPLPIDFKGLSERARLVETVVSDLHHRDIERRSSRTGFVHGIGGFTGTAEYQGDVSEFLPYLRAAWWTGVGRHTVWGNGMIEVVDIR